MRTLAILKRAFGADAWSTVAGLSIFLAAWVGVISADWLGAAYLFSLSAFFVGALVRAKPTPTFDEFSNWGTRALLVGGIGFLGVASAHAVGGDTKSAVLSGLLGVVALVSAGIEWRRTNAGRLSSGRH